MHENVQPREGTIKLRDGRKLAYAEYGDPSGWPVMFFHGTPGSRLFDPRSIRLADHKVRLITSDRPGYGLSDFRTAGLMEWGDDVAQLADALGIEQFSIAGPSGGTPYAAACAMQIPTRVKVVGLISGPAPQEIDRAGDGKIPEGEHGLSKETVAARTMTWPEFLTRFEQSWGSAPPDVEQIFEMLESWLPECDKKVLALPEVRASFRLMLPEAMRQGVPGWALDSWNMARPWGFRVEDIRVPTYLWHGELDRAAPVEAGRYLANAIPNCKATFYPDQGHLLAPECWHDILPPLIG